MATVVYHIHTSQHRTMTLYDSRGTHHVIKCARPSADENTRTRNYNLPSMRAWRREKAWFRGYSATRVCVNVAMVLHAEILIWPAAPSFPRKIGKPPTFLYHPVQRDRELQHTPSGKRTTKSATTLVRKTLSSYIPVSFGTFQLLYLICTVH